MAINLPMLVLLLTVAFIGFISIDEAEARALLPGSVERVSSSLIEEYSKPATLLVPSPSSPYGPAPFKSSLITEDDTTTMISTFSSSSSEKHDQTQQLIDLNHDDVVEDGAKSHPPPPPPPYSPYGPSPCRHSIQYNLCVTSPVVSMVDTI